jgi:hypothetical protein
MSIQDRVLARYISAGKLTPLQEVEYALGVASGDVPAYADVMGRVFWVERALSLFNSPRKKALEAQLGSKAPEVKALLEKIRDEANKWVEAQDHIDQAKADMGHLVAQAERLLG